ncbi:MAG: hypothetical protein J0L93_07270 [Deltaproteobacteria bacterium]|nr:hypothetical protein [Deltaproteobacteria bacterium]
MKSLENKIFVNTSNPGKLAEFQKFFADYSRHVAVEATQKSLPEPQSDPITVIRFKASQFENVIVDDVSLDVEGADLGVNIRWSLDTLDSHIGKSAVFICYLGVHRDGKIFIFKGEVSGKLVPPRGKSFGFNPYFLPDGAVKTLAEEKADLFNARYHALQNFIANHPHQICEPLKEWDGNFQGTTAP